jgi:hypothetical protein
VRIPQTQDLRFEPLNNNYRKSFANALPGASDQPFGPYANITIAARRRAIPSPKGEGWVRGKKPSIISPVLARISTSN